MFRRIIHTEHTIHHNTNSSLIRLVSLSDRKVALFYSNKQCLLYDLYLKSVIGCVELPGKPYLAVSISPNQVACLVSDVFQIVIINTELFNYHVLCKMPPKSSMDPQKDKQCFFESRLFSFREPRSFCVLEYVDNTKSRVLYFPRRDGKIVQTPQSTQYITQYLIFEPIDSRSKIAIYSQSIERDKPFVLKTVDLDRQQKDREGLDASNITYQIHHAKLNQKSIVQSVKAVRPNEYLIFANSNEKPFILLFNAKLKFIRQIAYEPPSNFQMICLFSTIKDIIFLTFMFKDKYKGVKYDNELVLINVNTGELIDKEYCNIQYCEEGWESDYFLDYRKETKPGNTTIVYSRHIVSKKSLMLKLMTAKNLNWDFSEDFCLTVLGLMEEQKEQ